MKCATKELSDKMNETISDVLARYESGEDFSGDGFSIIRWARNGWLTVKPDPEDDK